MSGLIALAVGGVIVVAVAALAWMTRERRGPDRDLGTISGQWIAEHRSQERQSDSR
jgi:hypothetical protein